MHEPLDGIRRRIARANRYIEEAKALMRSFASECEDRILANYNTQTPMEFPDVPSDLPLAVSDAIHNLRACLDYFVYELAIKDSGAIQQGTQFPLETVKSARAPGGNMVGFDIVAPRFLRGISKPHRDLIEKFQPYSGAGWARDLKDISNPDKHRHLTAFYVSESLSVWRYGPHHKGKKTPDGGTIEVDPTHTIFIELPDRNLWVVHTLYSIQSAIVDTISAFNVF